MGVEISPILSGGKLLPCSSRTIFQRFCAAGGSQQHHPGGMKPGTARSIIDALLSDVDDWEIYLSENNGNDDE